MTAVKFNQTVLRDGHQSLAATRMKTEQMLPVVEKLDNLGFNALETWGGAIIDSCLRFLAENPYDRLRALKKLSPKTPHQLLLRGQNIVQYQAFPDDVVRAFVKTAYDAGMTNFRIFDALNDLRNVRTAVKATKEYGGHAQGAISYTVSPVHTIEAFVQMAVEYEEMGADSVCIKDMAGLLIAPVAYDLVKAIKSKVKIPVALHSHNTAGLATTAYYAAVQAGIDILDCSIAPFANGTGQPDTILMQELLQGSGREPSYDREALFELKQYFEGIYKELGAYTSPKNEGTDVGILRYQVPGGMMSNFRNQLNEQGMGDKLEEVLAEIPYVRKCLGWIPLVTPTSQIVGTQAMINVKMGRWKMIAQNTKDIVLGKYGKTPGPVDPDVLKLVIAQTGEKPFEGRLADTLAPRMDDLKKELASKGLPATDEAAVLYAMFPQQTEAVYKGTAKPEVKAIPTTASTSTEIAKSRRVSLTVDGTRHDVLVEEYK
jgi:oxaloacetate decarboxylase alpha subunit/pyruvate carboxylase subunit B